MKKSVALNLRNLPLGSTSDDSDAFMLSDEAGDDFSDDTDNPRPFTGTISQQLSLFKMQNFEETKSCHLPQITDEEYNISNMNTPFLPRNDAPSIPVECTFLMIAGSNRFPRLLSDYHNLHPAIYMWRDVRNVLETEFTNYAQTYVKEHYTAIRTRLRFFNQVDPTVEKLNNVITLRRDIPNGRILYHYIGYGFPVMQDSTIPCIDKKTGNYVNYPLKTLFESIKPPSLFIFDCSNASSAIIALEKAAYSKEIASSEGNHVKEQFMTRSIDWNDWFCLCATDIGEQLPSDPHLPNDFLTACIFTPVKLAVVCHTLQFYRTSIVTNNFPLDRVDDPLFNPDSPISVSLEQTLSAIIDAIAVESLPAEMYRKLFRKDPMISLLFKRFVLAQYLLRSYQVHPVSRPNLPDLSIHPLWQHWKMIIDIAITSTTCQFSSIYNNLFIRSMNSVVGFLKRNQESEISPSLITLLFYFPKDSELLPKVYSTLAQYAASSEDARGILSKSAVFSSLFSALVSNDLNNDVLHNLCYLIVSLLQNSPRFVHEISKFDLGNFPNRLFDQNLPSQTKSLIAVIISTFVSINESARSIAVSKPFLTNIKTQLETSDPLLSLWLILIIRRMFDSYGYEYDVLYNSAIHTQIATFVHHNSHEVRAAALATLCCMLQQNEDNVNQQLFCLVFFTAFDPSYLVRYNFVLFLGRFLTFYRSLCNMPSLPKGSFRHQSFSSLTNQLFLNEGQFEYKPFSFNVLSSLASTGVSIDKLVSIGIYLSDLLVEDPHPSVRSAAREIRSFVTPRGSDDNVCFTQASNFSANNSPNGNSSISKMSMGMGMNSGLNSGLNNKMSSGFNSGMNSGLSTTKGLTKSISPTNNLSSLKGGNLTAMANNDNDNNLNKNTNNVPNLSPVHKMTISKSNMTSVDSFRDLKSASISSLTSNASSASGISQAMTSPLPESGGDAMYKVCINQIVNSGIWCVKDNEIPQISPISLPQPSLAINTTTKLSFRSRLKVEWGLPTHLAYHETSLSFAVATSDGVVAFVDERNGRSTTTAFDSRITSLSVNDWGLEPMILVGTDDGCISIWDPKQHTPRVTYRADWPGKSVPLPLVLSIVPGSNQIVSSRGNCGIVRLWDIEYQKLVAEYTAGANQAVTAITMNPLPNSNECVAGFQNGLIVELDLRFSEDRRLQNVAAPRANEEIVKIVGNVGKQTSFIAATRKGSCIKWINLEDYTVMSLGESAPIVDFDAHLHSPLMVFSPMNSPPIMTDFNGNVIHSLKSVGNGAVCAFHPVLPVIAFGTHGGEIIECELTG
ncbi:hypothetical protein TRFO_41141 [Tritrichomonas foetus]|uniref:Raptor N-terminal CASPase-like domain-containing protein n=1 Tax=Tritrichomonas foetus TaxID=1144522 RepID=A0A1J4L1I9_9EUKA|nr:hypothetical protein TRFO_41141 [Tritrichomonas foetus]|eukprot:OHT17282.1 hypothetical protein TRFO_41141 [Tritrichomonas foetus]